MIAAGTAVDGFTVALEHAQLPDAPDVTTALLPLGEVSGAEVGVWEMSVGAAEDTEADELFVVLSGRARVEFLNRDLETLEIRPGSIVRLDAGMHNRWTVTETLRKVYIA